MEESTEKSEESESEQTDHEGPAEHEELCCSSSTSADVVNEDDPDSVEGFRFIDIAVLATMFSSFWRPVCKYSHVVMEEDKGAKMGFASPLVLKCTARKCSFVKQFYTSAKVEKSKALK